MSGTEGEGGEAGAPGFLGELRARARTRPRRIVFPEGTEPRVHAALRVALEEELFTPVLIGSPEVIRAELEAAGMDVGRVRVVDPEPEAHRARLEEQLIALRAERGAPPGPAARRVRDPVIQAALLVALGEADGGVAGSVRTTADVVRAALGTFGLAVGLQTLSSAFFMVFDRGHPAGPRVLTFTDAAVVPEPTADQLADFATAASRAHRAVVGEEPRVAFLSYSTKGSADGASVTLAREALERFRETTPDVLADGELQADAAVVPSVADRKVPGSDLGGRASVLVFPDLASANIAYKLVQHLGGAHALGPILLGLDRPFNDLSRGATAEDIVAVACITSLMAE